jgi:apolipoprotein N-acyltransferase
MLLIAYALLTGAASALAFEPLGWWPLIFVAFAILCELLTRTKSLGQALAIGWAFGFGQFAVGLNWIATAFTFQAAMPAALGWVAVVVLSIYLAVYPALAAGLAWRFWRDNRVALLLLLAGAWALTEWLRGTLFTGFPWNPVAAAIVPTPLVTISALTGTYGLSAIVILLGGAVWLEVYRRWLPMVVIFAVTALLWLLPASPVPDNPLAIRNVRVVQPNIGQAERWEPGKEAEANRRLAALTGRPSAEPRLILWPESAITTPLQDPRPAGQAAGAAAAAQAAALLGPEDLLLTGGLALNSADGNRVDSATNSVFAIAPGGRIVGRYDKAHLVPYGEYLPMRPVLSSLGLARLAPGDMDFAAGPGPRTIDAGGLWGRIGFQLCYEIIFSGRVVDQTHRPSFIFNPSNDAWFGSWGPPQHLAQARLRAAEEGLPVIRATPTGISAVIDAKGQVVESLPWGSAGAIDAVLPPPAPASTFFGRLGNILAVAIGVLLIAGGLVFARGGIARKRRER